MILLIVSFLEWGWVFAYLVLDVRTKLEKKPRVLNHFEVILLDYNSDCHFSLYLYVGCLIFSILNYSNSPRIKN